MRLHVIFRLLCFVNTVSLEKPSVIRLRLCLMHIQGTVVVEAYCILMTRLQAVSNKSQSARTRHIIIISWTKIANFSLTSVTIKFIMFQK